MTGSGTSAEKQASTFTAAAGLAGSGGCSFRDAVGNHLRHHGFRGRSDLNDGTTTFAEDATFIARTGTASGSIRFESYNYPATTCAATTTNSGWTRRTGRICSGRTARSWR